MISRAPAFYERGQGRGFHCSKQERRRSETAAIQGREQERQADRRDAPDQQAHARRGHRYRARRDQESEGPALTLNAKLAYEVLDYIEAHPEKHDQATYFNSCGTTACFAGWASLLSGDEHTFDATHSMEIGRAH